MAAKFLGVGKLEKGKQKLGKLWNAPKHLFETVHIPINMIRSLIRADSIMIMFERGILEKAQSFTSNDEERFTTLPNTGLYHMGSGTLCILVLFMFYTASQLFWIL